MFGNPDFLVGNTALFVDGCFWHCCPEHFRLPKANRGFWERKFRRNRRRDLEVNERLAAEGHKVARIWEHETKDKLLREKLEELLHEKTDV
jgi:DNA mismatch endonuclease (patch repair protein)